MDYDFKKIAIGTCIATVVALAVGALLAFLNVGVYSFALGLVVGGLVAGYVDRIWTHHCLKADWQDLLSDSFRDSLLH